MQVTFWFDAEGDIGRLCFAAGDVSACEEVSPGLFLDYNDSHELIGIEILNVSRAAPALARLASIPQSSVGGGPT
jgi:uncharacterized protein YuzE